MKLCVCVGCIQFDELMVSVALTLVINMFICSRSEGNPVPLNQGHAEFNSDVCRWISAVYICEDVSGLLLCLPVCCFVPISQPFHIKKMSLGLFCNI